MSLGYVFLNFVLGGVALYAVIPDLLLHRLGIGSWKRQFGPGVTLTFDDGPDPEFTPRILEVLKKYHVSATFFVVAERAEKYPDLIQQIKEDKRRRASDRSTLAQPQVCLVYFSLEDFTGMDGKRSYSGTAFQ